MKQLTSEKNSQIVIRDNKKIFMALLKYLNHEKIEHCILGNLINFPDSITSDIDICVTKEDFENFYLRLRRFCTDHGLIIIQKLKHEVTAVSYVISALDQPNLDFMLDIYSDYRIKGRLIFTADEILKGKRMIEHNALNMAIPSDNISFVYYSIKHIYKQSFSATDRNYLLNLDIDEKVVASRLTSAIGAINTKHFLKLLINDQLVDLNTKVTKFSKSLFKSVNYPLLARLQESMRVLSRLIKPTGLFITILGPDGSGKSTIINKLVRNQWHVFRRFDTFHLRPSIWRRNNSVVVTDPHGKKPRGLLLTFIKLIYFIFDYIFGYAAKVYPKLIRSSLVIFDRYYYDIAVDPKRFRIQRGLSLMKCFNFFIPKPDLIFILYADADVLQSRKKEVSVSECQRQLAQYEVLSRKLEYAFLIDSEQPVDKIKYEIKKSIVHFLSNRFSDEN